jgi:anti-anti-sigma factor
MVTVGSSFVTLSDRPSLSRGGSEVGPIVVWLWGEHDASTDGTLCLTLARAIAVDSAGLVLDLSEVEFMAAPTVGVVVRARESLRQRSATLTMRAPSAPARRSIDACGLSDLLGPGPKMAVGPRGKALGSWVAVPAVERSEAQPGPSVPVPERVPARRGAADQSPESAGP